MVVMRWSASRKSSGPRSFLNRVQGKIHHRHVLGHTAQRPITWECNGPIQDHLKFCKSLKCSWTLAKAAERIDGSLVEMYGFAMCNVVMAYT